MNTGKTENHIRMQFEPTLIARFFSQILSKGVRCGACLPCGIKELLCEQIGLPPAYVDDRVQTVFLNGKPVDDLDTAVVVFDDSVALSAAMPGLLGAILRKDGYYAAMRREITHRSECAAAGTGDGFVTVKLFNLTVREVGPLLLEYGIWLAPSELGDFLHDGAEALQEACQKVTLDGNDTQLAALPEKLSAAELVFLQVNR